jgi:hypothetical protein
MQEYLNEQIPQLILMYNGKSEWSRLMNINNKVLQIDGWPRVSSSYATGWIRDAIWLSMPGSASVQEKREMVLTALYKVTFNSATCWQIDLCS